MEWKIYSTFNLMKWKMEWSGMEWKMERIFIFEVKWKGKKMEWKRIGKQNGKFLDMLSGMEKEWKGNGMESGMESFLSG